VTGLLGAGDVRALATRLGVRPTKSLGQNFVHDANTVRRVVRSADLTPGESVLEVGPGLGSLTLGLLEAGATVTAVEIDAVLARALPLTVAERLPEATERLRVVLLDALDLTQPTMPCGPPPTSLVANLPYNVGVPIILHLLDALPSLRSVLVMVQAEVAERLAAGPGSKAYGIPSVKAAWYATASRAGSVPRSVFWPVPNVDSGLVRLVRRASPTAARREDVFTVIDQAFAQRRKMLRSALAPWAGSVLAAEMLIREAAVDPRTRGETLDLSAFVRIAAAGARIRATQ
jgi:16S rRNA (adenine1518-N6/adenine1519-N6)-dimethyltransferase